MWKKRAACGIIWCFQNNFKLWFVWNTSLSWSVVEYSMVTVSSDLNETKQKKWTKTA